MERPGSFLAAILHSRGRNSFSLMEKLIAKGGGPRHLARNYREDEQLARQFRGRSVINAKRLLIPASGSSMTNAPRRRLGCSFCVTTERMQ